MKTRRPRRSKRRRPMPISCATNWWSTRCGSASLRPTAPLYDSLQQRLRTASVQSGLESLEIDVVDQALPPAEPVLRPQSTVILTALVFSLLAGIVVAFLMESLDTGLRSIAEIESITELAVTGHHSASAQIVGGSGRDPHHGTTKYRYSDPAEVAVCRSVPFPANLAAALQYRPSAEVHCSDQCHALGRQDDGGKQPCCDPGATGHARSADRRRPSAAQHSSSVRVEREDRV